MLPILNVPKDIRTYVFDRCISLFLSFCHTGARSVHIARKLIICTWVSRVQNMYIYTYIYIYYISFHFVAARAQNCIANPLHLCSAKFATKPNSILHAFALNMLTLYETCTTTINTMAVCAYVYGSLFSHIIFTRIYTLRQKKKVWHSTCISHIYVGSILSIF